MSFTTDWTLVKNDPAPCRKCDTVGGIEYRGWESSCGAYEDYQYRCIKCGAEWWIEGPDA